MEPWFPVLEFHFNLILVILHVGHVFGQLWRLEPLPAEKKSMWRREMELLLCVGDHIVELIPSWQTFPDGSKLEVILIIVPILEMYNGNLLTRSRKRIRILEQSLIKQFGRWILVSQLFW